MKKHTLTKLLKSPATFITILGLILEFPVRYYISPDPWIHSADHWYFIQPTRLFIELGFVLLALSPFFWIKELKSVLRTKWTNNNFSFFIYGLIGSVAVFTFQQWGKINTIHELNLYRYLAIWFITGFLIGVGQELTFRGLIFTGINKILGLKPAIILSTICFVLGSIHSVRVIAYFGMGYVIEPVILLIVFTISGLLFAWIRIKTNSILIPSVIHGAGNAITWATFVTVKLNAAI